MLPITSAERTASPPRVESPPAPPPSAPIATGPSGREIVDRHTRGNNTDAKAVAADLKDEIRQRPQEATRLTMQALEHVKADERDEVAQEFIRAHSDTELKTLAHSDAGKGALALAVNELGQGSVHKHEAQDAARVGDALGQKIELKVNTGWASVSGAIHTVLDVAGFIPGLGAIPDLVNAGIYAAEGDWANAALSSTAAIPLAGDAIKGGAMAVKAGREVLAHGDDVVNAGKQVVKHSDDVVDAGKAVIKKNTDDVAGAATVKLDTRAHFRAASKNPQPNTTYEFDGFKYKTDEFGRGTSSSGELKLNAGGNRFHDDYKIGHEGQPGDIGFHAGADRFGFHGGKLNISPGNRALNGNEYARFENKLNALLKEGKHVDAEFRSVFNPGNTSARPDRYEVVYRVDGGPPRVKSFLNQPGG